MRRDRKLKEGEENFSVQTSEEIIRTFNDMLEVLFIAIVGIASISLLVGSIGVMNTMYTSVLDRTQEIGVMKAIGATKKDILSVFIIEAGILALIGGVIGVTGGIVLSFIIEYIAVNYFLTTMLSVYIDPLVISGVLIFSFLIGIISGVMPAKKASELKPIDALRWE